MIAFVCNSPIHIIRAFSLMNLEEFRDKSVVYVGDIFPNSTQIVKRINELDISVAAYEVKALKMGKTRIARLVYGKHYGIKQYSFTKIVSFNIVDSITQALYYLNRNNEGFEYHCMEDTASIYKIYAPKPYKWYHPYKVLGIDKQAFHIDYWWSSCADYIDLPGEFGAKKRQLPRIEISDIETLKRLNHIFEYEKCHIIDDVDVLFMEESHYTDGTMTDNYDYRLFMEIRNRYPDYKFAVKLHPRSAVNRFENEFRIIDKPGVPWELHVWNRMIEGSLNVIQVGIVCATMMSDKLIFGYEGKKIIMGPMFYDIVKPYNGVRFVSAEEINKFKSIKNMYSDKDSFVIVESKEELFSVLDRMLKKEKEHE